MKFICTLCNYILEEDQGRQEAGIAPGTSFDDLPEDWSCPNCAAKKQFFQTCSCVSLSLYEACKVAPDQKKVGAA